MGFLGGVGASTGAWTIGSADAFAGLRSPCASARFGAGFVVWVRFVGRDVFRDAARTADPDRAALARFWAGLRAEVRGLETRRVFAIDERHDGACSEATVTNWAQIGQDQKVYWS